MDEVEKIDVGQFITEIEARPSIWDNRSEEYKDRSKKDAAWYEICFALVPNFSHHSKSERKLICRKVQQKWRNIRDYHRKYTLKLKRSGWGSAKKFKYIYNGKLAFLTPLLGISDFPDKPEDQTLVTEPDVLPIDDNSDDPVTQDVLESPTQTAAFSSPRSAKAKSTTIRSELQEKVCNFFDSYTNPTPLVEDEDKSFLDSLLPTLRNFDTDQKLEFRVEVLRVMQRIRHEKLLDTIQNTCTQENQPEAFRVFPKQEM